MSETHSQGTMRDVVTRDADADTDTAGAGDGIDEDYSFEQKERLARRIQKLKKPKYYAEIERIITEYNPELDITTNPSGKFMYFQNLRQETYHVLDEYVHKIIRQRELSETSEGTKYSSEVAKYSEDEDPFSRNSRLRYSNKERNLIKRKIYDRSITAGDGDGGDGGEASVPSAPPAPAPAPVQNNVFVKRKLNKPTSKE